MGPAESGMGLFETIRQRYAKPHEGGAKDYNKFILLDIFPVRQQSRLFDESPRRCSIWRLPPFCRITQYSHIHESIIQIQLLG